MIKELDETYYEELYSLEQEIFSYHQKMRPDDFKEIHFSKDIYYNLIQYNHYFIYGYFSEENLVGAIYVNRRDNIYYIVDIVVSASYQNKGIGTLLLEFI